MCAGQILGVRMSLLGLNSLGIENPLGADRKRLVAYVEIDRCATDAIGMVTGCRLGKRTLEVPRLGQDGRDVRGSFHRARGFASSRSRTRAISLASSILKLKAKAISRCWPTANSATISYSVWNVFEYQSIPRSCRDIRRIASCVPVAARESISDDSKRLPVSGSALLARTLNCATGHPSETHAQGGRTWGRKYSRARAVDRASPGRKSGDRR